MQYKSFAIDLAKQAGKIMKANFGAGMEKRPGKRPFASH